MRRALCPTNQSVGVIEWVQFIFGGGRVAVASVPNVGHHEIMIYADHEEAPLRLHSQILALGIEKSRSLRRRRPMAAAFLLSAGLALLATLMTNSIHNHHHYQDHVIWGFSEMGAIAPASHI